MAEANSWGKFADWYDEHLADQNTYQRRVILPNLLRLMEIRKGDRVLDLACGQGFFSRAFVVAGVSVIGADISSELIARARERAPSGVTFHSAPAHRMPFLKNGSIDKIACVLAIQNIENAQTVFAECSRVLTPQGKLYLVLNHPAFRVPKGSSWGWDTETQTQYRRIDQYLSESRVKIEMHPGDKPGAYTVSFHRPLQFYFKALQKAGFAVTRLEEWNSHKRSEPGPRQKAEDRARKEIPLFLFLEAAKL